jgi:hypothetical protein
MSGKIGSPATRDNVQSQEPGGRSSRHAFSAEVAFAAREAGQDRPLPRDKCSARIDAALYTSLSLRRLNQWLYLASLKQGENEIWHR